MPDCVQQDPFDTYPCPAIMLLCHHESAVLKQVGQFFKLRQRKSKLTTELRAGLVTFLTVSHGW